MQKKHQTFERCEVLTQAGKPYTVFRKMAASALERQQAGSEGAATWLSEPIWRDFYAQILSNFPHAAASAFKPDHDAIAWEQGDKARALFQAWCEGQTG